MNHPGLLDEVSSLSADLVERGWAEGTSGNLSVRLRVQVPEAAGVGDRVRGGIGFVAGHVLICSSSGVSFAQAARDPALTLCALAPDDDLMLRIVYGSRPTTEIRSHAAAHVALHARDSPRTVVLHVHVPTPVLSSATGARAAAVIPSLPPGSPELARATGEAFSRHDRVIWSSHGVVVASVDLRSAPGVVASLLDVT